MSDRILVQAADFDVATEIAAIRGGGTDVGAIVSFTGVCRNEAGRLAALELETYSGMAEQEIGRIADEARHLWPLSGLTVIHRFGRMTPGDNIVLVVVAAAHRGAAFEAAEYLMDFLKTRAPFWKREITRAGREAWVENREADELAAARWQTRAGED
jgi:molybdopterin synthase catalytic subunit